MRGEFKARRGVDAVRIERRGATRKSAATPIGPQGCGGMGPSFSLPLLDDALASPASRRLEYGPMALATDDTRLSGRASSRAVGEVQDSAVSLPNRKAASMR
ncbi:MAG: hypothetical protein V3T16_01235, partial [Gemmatimonadales bacterium]